MAYLTINGFEVRVASLSASSDDTETVERGASGRMIVDRRAERQSWDIELALDEPAQYKALLNMVRGNGHTFSFELSVASSKGLLQTSGTATFGAASPAAKFGLFRALTTSDLVYTFSGYFEWTVSLWVWTGSAWQLRAQNSNGDKWQNGVKGTYSWAYPLTVGALTLPDATYYDDLVVLPYTLPDVMMAAWPTTRAWPLTPYVTLGGDALGGAIYTAVKSGQITEDFVAGPANTTLATPSFTLREV